MVKLIRLTSNDNCNFKVDLDAGIDIKENASIALQNLTFETLDFTAFRVNANNSGVGFQLLNPPPDPASKLTADLTVKNYTKDTITDFYIDLETTLNQCLGVGALGEDIGNAYGNFKVFYYKQGQESGVENTTIMFKLSPMIMLFNFNDIGDPRANDGNFLFQRSRDSGVPTLTIQLINGGNEEVNLGDTVAVGAATSDFKKYVYPNYSFEWCRGSAMFMARVHHIVDNTGAADTNGFCVGLSFSDLAQVTNGGRNNIPTTARDFEIRIKRPTDKYEFISPAIANTPQVSSLDPYAYITVSPSNPLLNDHILFERKQGVIIGSVLSSDGGGTKTVLFNYTLTKEEMGKSIYPYYCMFGAAANATLGRPIVTINPIIKPFSETENNNLYKLTGMKQGIAGGLNAFNDIANAGIGNNVVPVLEDKVYDEDPMHPNYPENYNPKLTINAEVLRMLAFDPDTYPGTSDYIIQTPQTLLSQNNDDDRPFLQFDIVSDGISNLVNSDNYVVLLDSNPLYSYDASQFDYTDTNNIQFLKYNRRGRRLNILATLPVNDNNGTVEFDSSELVYIDFDNRFPQTIKNLRLRVLDKDFNEIRTNGESIMTLLIKDN
tara:strand:+ start:1349 stop:3163 length:1815 start_codon:yes stop_codon:yes gene_type:complete